MTYISPSNQTLLRKQPHDVELSLSIWQPTIVFKCRVNNSAIAKNARAIAYDTVSLGSYTVVEADMTLWVGTQPGLDDVGKVRIRSITSSTITVAENSDILWADNQYLTVINQREMWPVYPRMIQDESNPTTVLWYKDYDVAYTNENSILGSFICMGGNRAGDLRNGSHQEYFSASGTVNVAGSAISSYYWEFEGASPASGTTHTPGMVTWDTPGDYIVSLKTTAANGGTDTSYRYVKIEDTPSVTSWELSRPPTGSRADGESTCELVIYDLPDSITIRPQTIVTIYSKERRGETTQNLSGNVFYTGYVRDGSITHNYDAHSVSFELVSIIGLMKESENFGVSLEYAVSPTDWYEIAFATLKPAIYHYLKYHSTVLSLADYEFIGTDRNIQYFDIARETLYGGLNNLLKNTLFMEVVADRKGKIWSEVMSKAVDDAPTTFPYFMEIQKQDWVGEPNIKVNYNKPLSYIELNGIQFSTTGVSTPLIGCAPGSAPGTEGKAKRQSGLALSSQTQLNTLCGNIYTNENYKFPQLSMTMRGAWTHLDIAPQEAYKMSISAEDTITGVDISGSYFVESLSWEYDHTDGYLSPMATWDVITQNDLVGDTIEVPPAPPVPPISNPSPTPPPPPPPLPEEPVLTLEIVYVLTNLERILACGNFNYTGNQVWHDITPDGDVDWSTNAIYGTLQVDWNSGSLFANDLETVYQCQPYKIGEDYFFQKMYARYLANNFAIPGVPINNTFKGVVSVNPITGELFAIGHNPLEGAIKRYAIVGDVYSTPSVYGSISSGTLLGRNSIGNGVLLHGTNSGFQRSIDGGITWTTKNLTGDEIWNIRPDPVGDIVYYHSTLGISNNAGQELGKSTDLGDTGGLITGGSSFEMKVNTGISSNPDMSIMMGAANDTGTTHSVSKSTDGGANWALVSGALKIVGSGKSAWCGYDSEGNDVFMFVQRTGTTEGELLSHFEITNDAGATWTPNTEVQAFLQQPETIEHIAVVLLPPSPF